MFRVVYLLAFTVMLHNVFFFKQKTAYEMRISDWSSDVCSSDLEIPYRRPAVSTGTGAQEQKNERPSEEPRIRRVRRPTWLHRRHRRRLRARPIGRASCRERVCQHV